jgi:hypothetical protein
MALSIPASLSDSVQFGFRHSLLLSIHPQLEPQATLVCLHLHLRWQAMRDGDSGFDLEPHEHGADETEEEEAGNGEIDTADGRDDDATVDADDSMSTRFSSTCDGDEAEAVTCNAIAFIIADTSSSTGLSLMVPLERRSENRNIFNKRTDPSKGNE